MLGPIFGREWLTLPRRSRHYVTRSVYLGALWILLLTIWQVIIGWEYPATLGDHARFGLSAFQILAYIQLTLLLFFSALIAASAVAQEKDRRTFVLLLLTDLRNHEIVVGKLLGSLLQIGMLLAGFVPFLALLALLGGLTGRQIMDATLVMATTCLAAGSLGVVMALWRDKTFQALALTVLFLVLYLCLVHGLALVPGLNAQTVRMWQGWLEPYTTLIQVFFPDQERSGLSAAHGYALAMLGMAVLLNGFGMWKLRVWNPAGEPVMQREQVADEGESEVDRARAHAAPGPVRAVWTNPILWREIITRAYGRRPLLVKAAYFVAVGLLAYYFVFVVPPSLMAAGYGLVSVTILSLLLISTQAVTAITSERDLGALDLLMVTDLSPNEFIFGKLLGICYNAKEFLLPPLILAAVYAARGQLATPPRGHPELALMRNLQALVCVELALLVLMAFTVVLGIHVALRTEISRLAVINTLGTIFFLSVGTLICIRLILITGRFEYQWLSFSGFIGAGVGGLLWVLSGNRPSPALSLASWACPIAVFYTITNILIGRPGTLESTQPYIPFMVLGSAFGFTLAAMLVPLLSEFDVAIGRTSAIGE
jgi:ABC-type transport system involved in multi-copper enzyme maturation permease subunit